ncbi:MAG: tetratricopeptide repeat protein [Candidatus Gracilibacteria bacterium]|nr:tetratricopeptide repeat protein [Candidatus Gracilibacteria bacterium]
MKENYKKYYEKGLRLRSSGEWEEALEILDKSINIKPNIGSYICKSSILRDLGYYEESIEVSKKVLKIDSENSKAYYNIGLISFI